VGAQTRVWRPAMIAGHPPDWASVGPSGNRRSNQARTAGWNRSRIPGESVTVWVDGSELTTPVHHIDVTGTEAGVA